MSKKLNKISIATVGVLSLLGGVFAMVPAVSADNASVIARHNDCGYRRGYHRGWRDNDRCFRRHRRHFNCGSWNYDNGNCYLNSWYRMY